MGSLNSLSSYGNVCSEGFDRRIHKFPRIRFLPNTEFVPFLEGLHLHIGLDLSDNIYMP